MVTQVGHLKLTSFTGRAQQDLAAAIARLEAQGAQELVLDLRNNGGGIINGGVEIAQLFLNGASLPSYALSGDAVHLQGIACKA